MTQSEYIAAAFKAYWPTAEITVDDTTDDEIIYVTTIISTGEPNHFNQTTWFFIAGSDDDRYTFVRYGAHPDNRLPTDVITVPLMAEGD